MKNYNIRVDGISHEVFDNEVVALNLVDGKYYSMEEVACYVWQSLAFGIQTAEIVERLAALNIESSINLQAEVIQFLEQLHSEGLTEIKSSDAPFGNSLNVPLPDKYTRPVLEVFSDMKEVIALDPVHDVSAKGWPEKKN